MITKYLIPFLSICGVILAAKTVVLSDQPPPLALPVANPAKAPFDNYVAGAGIVEANSENIEISTTLSGLVTSVNVRPGDVIKKGDVLFELDNELSNAELQVKQSELLVAKSQLREAELQYEIAKNISVGGVSREELLRRSSALEVGKARLSSAEASLRFAMAENQKLKVTSPIDGSVLQVKVRVGEFAPASRITSPLMIVGKIDPLHVRVDIDEYDAWRVLADQPAIAFLRGNSEISVPLKFVSFEPYIVPKRSLTGDSTERVDTRVLQAIFSFDKKDLPIFVGQQMDIFIKSIR